MTSLYQVIEFITSGPSPLTIESVQNVSDEYAAILTSNVAGLEDDQQQRRLFIEQFGKGCWREHKFLMAWESGLLTSGYLTRWRIMARK
jgi:hypothetical protein